MVNGMSKSKIFIEPIGGAKPKFSLLTKSLHYENITAYPKSDIELRESIVAKTFDKYI